MTQNEVRGSKLPEPWLRGTLTEIPAVTRAVLHALQLAEEDLLRWCEGLDQAQLHARPAGLPSIAFHLRHIAGTLDRLLTYAEGRSLNAEQLQVLQAENAPDSPDQLWAGVKDTFRTSATRVMAFAAANLEEPRKVGRRGLPSTVGGLLVHLAEHTQRHTGQAIATARVVRAGLK
jgi:uncharacterized damage-inducible protein DinB